MTCDPWPLRNGTQVYERAFFAAKATGEGTTLPVLGLVAPVCHCCPSSVGRRNYSEGPADTAVAPGADAAA